MHVISNEGAPGMRRRPSSQTFQVAGDGCFGYPDSEYEQLAVNPWCTPERILAGQPADEFSGVLIDARSAATISGDSAPVQAIAHAMPLHHGLWLYDRERATPLRPVPREHDPEKSVGVSQSDTARSEPLFEYRDLMSQGDDLALPGCASAEQVTEDSEEEPQHERGDFP
jgi:hypothetical protein